jgi:HTH-type transcriptional regulator/antitoxin HipB
VDQGRDSDFYTVRGYLQRNRHSVYCSLDAVKRMVRQEPVDQITRTPKQLGQLVRRRRKELGLSQEAVGSRISLRQSTLSALETSAADSRLGTVLDVLAALDLELVIRPRTKGSAREIEELF